MKRKNAPHASLVQVARKAGVSIATASRVLNGQPVTEDKKEKVLAAAKSLHYVQNPYFRRIRRSDLPQQTGNLAVLLSPAFGGDLHADILYNRIFAGVQSRTVAARRNLMVGNVDGLADGQLPQIVADGSVDGVVLLPGHSLSFVRRLSAVLPCVAVADRFVGVGVPCVSIDEEQVVRVALEHLAALGHRRIAFFYVDDGFRDEESAGRHLHPHVLRARAFRAIAADLGLAEARVVAHPPRDGKSLEDTVTEVLRGWRAKRGAPTAVLCAADVYAIEFIHAADTLGVPVPREMSVMGIDNWVVDKYLRPAITSVEPPVERMGEAAVDLLLARIDDPKAPSTNVSYDVTLVERDSTGPAPKR